MKTHLLSVAARSLLAWFSLSLFTCPGRAQSNVVLLVSSPGDYIGQGNVYVTTNPASFTFYSYPSYLGISAFGYWIQFSPPYGAPLTVGSYTNVPNSPFGPAVSVSGNSRGCSQYCGSFQVLEIHTNSAGTVDRFWATLTQRCECLMPPLTGEIRYNSALAPPVPPSKTLQVPSQYSTIQAAMDAASPLGLDTVLVGPGVYSEVVSFRGKDIRVISEWGPGFATIRGPYAAPVVLFAGSETALSLFSGFNVQSTVPSLSSGVVLNTAAAQVENNLVLGCQNGITAGASSATLRSNTVQNSSGTGISFSGIGSALIEGNTATGNQTGIALSGAGTPVVRNNFVAANRAGGISLSGYSDADLVQNVIVSNIGHGLSWQVPSGRRGPRAINNTIFQNTGSGIYADGYDTSSLLMNNLVVGTPALTVGTTGDTNLPVVHHNDFFSPAGAPFAALATNLLGLAANSSTNPLFVCEPSGDLRLLPVSPCLDAGTNDSLRPADFNGSARLLDGDLNGVPVVDLGAFELNPAALPQPCLYVTCPTNPTVNGLPGQTSVVATFPPPTGHPAAQLAAFPPSGTAFPGGTNVVACTATYGTNSALCLFSVVVNTWPMMGTPPQSTNLAAGAKAAFSVTMTNTTPPITYQWWKRGPGAFTNLVATTNSGAFTDTYTTPTLWAADSGAGYYAVARNAAGAVTSAVATVTIPCAQFSAAELASGSNFVLRWSGGGILESATNLAGPWGTVTNAQSPSTNLLDPRLPRQFFRVRQ